MKREFLVTQFVCAKCFKTLELSNSFGGVTGPYVAGEPTGAAMQKQCVAIEPCKTCLAPVDEVRAAMRTLMAIK